MLRKCRISKQQVLIKLTPEQLSDPDNDTSLARIKLALILHQGGMQTLARRNEARSKVRRQNAGARNRRKIAVGLVLNHACVGKLIKPLERCPSRGRPRILQVFWDHT